MNEEIRAFIRENREIAKTQAERWQGVDPSRLLQALDYLEVILDRGTAPPDVDLDRQSEAAARAVATLMEIGDLRDQKPRHLPGWYFRMGQEAIDIKALAQEAKKIAALVNEMLLRDGSIK